MKEERPGVIRPGPKSHLHPRFTLAIYTTASHESHLSQINTKDIIINTKDTTVNTKDRTKK
jgi:hypothetical protein